MMNRLKNLLASALDVVLSPVTVFSGLSLLLVRRLGFRRVPLSRALLTRIGLLPVRHHYYEPMVTEADLISPLEAPRDLPGIDFDVAGQLALLHRMTFAGEIADFAGPRTSTLEFRLQNGSYESGDAEYLYQMLRLTKPRRFVEVGCGQSTLIAQRAFRRNASEGGIKTDHVCIEPYEAPWLESAGVTRVIRSRIEKVDLGFFETLEAGDILFIDSSHVIRPQGDVLFEYLQVLPRLAPGVIVHIHDIFSPYEYPREWLLDSMLLWNEQYLLEGLLTENPRWKVIGALNLLARTEFSALKAVCPFLTPERAPGSFWIQRR